MQKSYQISLITILLLKMFGLTSLFSQITDIYPAKHELLIFLIFLIAVPPLLLIIVLIVS